MKFEEAFCLFLLDQVYFIFTLSLWYLIVILILSQGLSPIMQGDEATAAEKLWQLELNSSPAARKLLSDKEAKDVSNSRKSLVSFSGYHVMYKNYYL